MSQPSDRKADVRFRKFRTSRKLDVALDHIHYVTALFAPHYFRNDPLKEFEAPKLSDLIGVDPPEPRRLDEKSWSVTLHAGGAQRTARVHWREEPTPGRPVLVYHHGAGSIPWDKVFGRLLPPDLLQGWNVACIQAASHRSLREYFDSAFDSLDHAILLFATSIHALESVARWSVRHGAPYTAFCGVSLGGMMTSLHMCAFGTGDIYIPALAGLNIHHLFFSGTNRALAHRRAVRSRMKCYRDALDFTDWIGAATRRPCFPLLAKHDLMVDYEEAKRCWSGYPISTIKRGHTSGVSSYHQITEHFLTHLPSF